MNKRNYIISLSVACLSMGACKKSSFVDANINPNTLYSVDPADQFLAAAAGSQDDFEFFYDVLRAEMQWMQYSTGAGGTPAGTLNITSNFNGRYAKVFYGRTGTYLSDIPNMVSKLPASEQPKRLNQMSIAAIFKAYYAFYVSDINGDIPYSEAFQARYGGTVTPKYDRQQALFDTLDAQIKKAVASLEATDAATQTTYGAKDPFYASTTPLTNVTEAQMWIKFGNALRLKIAMRLMKRDPNKLKSIATEVLADSKQMSAYTDSWVLYAGPSYANSANQGNWNPTGFLAGKPVVDFMKTNGDPRLGMYYRPAIKTGTYVGAPTNPDSIAPNTNLFQHSDSLVSQLQHRMLTPDFDEGSGAGTGTAFFPFLTYAEYCFIRAELGAKAITGDNPETWYNAGITASINFYNDRALGAKVPGYAPIDQDTIAKYLTKVKYDPAKGLDQIYCQAYLDFFRQPSEAWAWWKRTGYPNTTSTLAWEPTTFNGATLTLPRRAAITVLTTADLNYQNQQTAIAAMKSDGNWGDNPADFKGRVWWDMP